MSYGSKTYTYTANGELATKTDGTDVTTYSYDVVGNLRTVVLPTGVTIDYVIDAANRRVGKKVNGTLVQGFLYQSQLAPAAELDGSGNIVSQFVYATKGNVPDYIVKAGVTYRLFTDHLGSVRLVVNAATGAIAQRIDYDAFGRIQLDTNPAFHPFGFAGGIYDTQPVSPDSAPVTTTRSSEGLASDRIRRRISASFRVCRRRPGELPGRARRNQASPAQVHTWLFKKDSFQADMIAFYDGMDHGLETPYLPFGGWRHFRERVDVRTL